MSTSLPPNDRRVKIPHLVFALLFLGLVVIWSLGSTGVLRGESLTILGPAVLIAAGVIGLGASLAGSRNRGRAQSLTGDEYAGHAPYAGDEYPSDPGPSDHLDHTDQPDDTDHPDDTEELR